MGLFDILFKAFFPHLSFGLGGDDEGGGGQTGGYDIVTMPTWDWNADRWKYLWDMSQGQLSSLMQGGIPSWIANSLYGSGGNSGSYQPGSVGYGMNRQLENTTYGLPGQRYGAIPTLLSTAAVTGAGGATANRMAERATQNYSEQAKRIDEFINEQAFTGSQNSLNTFGNIAMNIPQGPPSQVVQYGGYQTDTSGAMSNIGQGLFNLGSQLLTGAFTPTPTASQGNSYSSLTTPTLTPWSSSYSSSMGTSPYAYSQGGYAPSMKSMDYTPYYNMATQPIQLNRQYS